MPERQSVDLAQVVGGILHAVSRAAASWPQVAVEAEVETPFVGRKRSDAPSLAVTDFTDVSVLSSDIDAADPESIHWLNVRVDRFGTAIVRIEQGGERPSL
jgi:hypothetical protein